jgi:hypothetical protein
MAIAPVQAARNGTMLQREALRHRSKNRACHASGAWCFSPKMMFRNCSSLCLLDGGANVLGNSHHGGFNADFAPIV